MPPARPRDLPATIAANREGIDVYFDVVRNIDADRWAAPVTPGKWSPAQITDHLTRAYDFGTAVINGTLSGHTLPAPLRWLLGRFWFSPVIRAGRFTGKVKAPKFFMPLAGTGETTDLLAKLRAASERFASAVESRLSSGQQTVLHPMFGTISLLEFLELQVIHVRHHRAQLPQVS